jgi:hypothetical protein
MHPRDVSSIGALLTILATLLSRPAVQLERDFNVSAGASVR